MSLSDALLSTAVAASGSGRTWIAAAASEPGTTNVERAEIVSSAGLSSASGTRNFSTAPVTSVPAGLAASPPPKKQPESANALATTVMAARNRAGGTAPSLAYDVIAV